MSAIAAAIAGTAVVGAYSANKASKAQQRSADTANQAQLEMYYQSRDDQKPWMDTGRAGLNKLAHLLGVNDAQGEMPAQSISRVYQEYLGRDPDEGGLQNYLQHYNQGMSLADIERNIASSEEARGLLQQGRIEPRTNALYANAMRGGGSAGAPGGDQGAAGSLLANFTEKDFWEDPVTKLGFDFGLKEGTKGLNNQLAANGSLNSGAALKALTRYAADYTGTKGNEAFNRFNVNQDKTYNRLATLAGVGQNTSAQMGGQALQTGQNIGNNLMGAGNARASGYIGMANAVNGAVGMGVNAYQTNELIKRYPVR